MMVRHDPMFVKKCHTRPSGRTYVLRPPPRVALMIATNSRDAEGWMAPFRRIA